jgi:hypothetical protein
MRSVGRGGVAISAYDLTQLGDARCTVRREIVQLHAGMASVMTSAAIDRTATLQRLCFINFHDASVKHGTHQNLGPRWSQTSTASRDRPRSVNSICCASVILCNFCKRM